MSDGIWKRTATGTKAHYFMPAVFDPDGVESLCGLTYGAENVFGTGRNMERCGKCGWSVMQTEAASGESEQPETSEDPSP